MTSPVAPPAPAVRPASAAAGDASKGESAAPFASALDGALAGHRPPVEEDSPGADGEAAPDQAATDPTVPAEAGTEAPTAAVPAVVWALALAQAAGETAVADGPPLPDGLPAEDAVPAVGTPVAAGVGHTPGTPPGRAVAEARAQGVAAGLRDLPGSGPDVDGAVPPSARPAGTPAAGTLPATAAAQAQAQAQLRAALATAGATAGGATPDVTVVAADPAPAPAPTPAGTPAAVAPVAAAVPTTPSAAVPAADAVVPPPGAPGTDTPGAETGASGGGGDGVPEVAATTAPLTGAAPVADADPATGTTTSAPVSAQVTRQVAVLRGAADGSHTMTLVLTPESLGPVEVSVTVSQGTLDLTLRGAHEHGRAALLDALPDLRRDLEAAGLTVSRVEVARDGAGSRFSDQPSAWGDRQQGFGERGGQNRGDSRSRPWLGAADTTGGPTPMALRTTSSGVDVRV